MDWLGISIVLVVGVGAVAYGYLWDRTTNRRRNDALAAPPDRPIPGLPSDASAPSYVLPQQLDAKPSLPADELDALRARLDGADTLRHGHGRGAFATDRTSGLAVLPEPLILIVDGPLSSMRELLTPASRATTQRRPLVVVAERISDEVFQTLEANALAAVLPCVAVIMPSADHRAQLARLVGASALSPADLKMGWVPDGSLGRCPTWVSSPDQLWVLPPA